MPKNEFQLKREPQRGNLKLSNERLSGTTGFISWDRLVSDFLKYMYDDSDIIGLRIDETGINLNLERKR